MRGLTSSVALVLAVATIVIGVPSVTGPLPVPNIAASLTPNGADGLTPLCLGLPCGCKCIASPRYWLVSLLLISLF